VLSFAHVQQSDIVRATGVTQTTVNRLVNGRTRSPDIVTIRALCDGLGIPREMAGLRGTRWPPAPAEEEATNRRDFIKVSSGAALALSLGVASGPASADADAELRALEDAAPKLLELNDEWGGAEGLCEMAHGLAARADGLLQRGDLRGGQPARAQEIAVRLAMYAGWLYYDGGDQSRARGAWLHASQHADFAEDSLNLVYALESMSAQAAYFLERPYDAVNFARRAQRQATGWAPGRLRSLLHMREAAGWAAQGRSLELHAQERLARCALESDAGTGEPEPDWLRFYGQAELEGLSALAQLQVGNNREAQHRLEAVVAGIEPAYVRNRVYYTAVLAKVRLINGDATGAAERLRPLLADVVATGSWRTHQHLHAALRLASAGRTAAGLQLVDEARALGVPA
jgi:transcriptional regulator with XRE-family HTH domain